MKDATPRLLQKMQNSMLRRDYFRLKSALNKAKNPARKNRVLDEIEQAHQHFNNRQKQRPHVKLAADLPVSEQADIIRQSSTDKQVTFLAG